MSPEGKIGFVLLEDPLHYIDTLIQGDFKWRTAYIPTHCQALYSIYFTHWGMTHIQYHYPASDCFHRYGYQSAPHQGEEFLVHPKAKGSTASRPYCVITKN